MVQLTPEQRTLVIKTFYQTNSLQQARVAFRLTTFAVVIDPHMAAEEISMQNL
jgi:phage FluMu protein gp41